MNLSASASFGVAQAEHVEASGSLHKTHAHPSRCLANILRRSERFQNEVVGNLVVACSHRNSPFVKVSEAALLAERGARTRS